ncbi:GSCFA domain-containing protein [Anianabacter salinae]|uniref:GSCFA domain-containing protein n=1 Tax=Anianabacter salinae TaxID=2851023 RepID=UPI00225E1559|nr:GSCFA domain-containing protein [Anianabacter salinae]MBV0912655.1 GSCFA domain-containing protein [Anianabacter salinae]
MAKTTDKMKKDGTEMLVTDEHGTQSLVFQKTTKATRDHRTWFRGESTNFNPKQAQMIGTNAVIDNVLHGWAPEKPMLKPSTQITAFGSCFATNISKWLSARNFNVLNKSGEDAEDAKSAYVVTMGEGMVNSFVIRQQFEWAWENKTFEQPLWHGYKAEEFGYDEEIRLETRKIFDETEFFILTFGLSEVWYDEPTNNVFWRTIPKDVYDPERHKFRVSSVEENRDNMLAIYDLIRKHRPDARILFTLSPIPLIATFRDVSCLTANSVSKSVLRVAIDEVMREKQDEGYLYYWPSYEIITDVFRLPYRPDRRHPPQPTLDYIMTLFEHVWCDEDEKPSLAEAWVKAQASAGNMPGDFYRITNHRKLEALDRWLAKESLSRDVEQDIAMRELLMELRAEWTGEREAAE